MTPETLGRYQILGELGKGAMGVVFLARDPVIGRQVALKTFRLGYSADDEELAQFRARFLREAQSAGILNHPNIVTIHDVIDEGNGETCFIAMEYVKGTDLKQLMQRQKRLELPFVVDVVAQIADGLDYAHSKGVVHRDVKPANIIITAAKEVKITDFGIARVDASNLTTEGQLLGTPNYMAPEQIQGKDVDHRADLFSLGVMLYEMLTTKKPFQGENLTVVTHRIVHDAFTPPERYVADLPPAVLRVLEKALQKDPAQRYQRGSEMARDLRALLTPPAPAAAAEQRAAPSTSFLDPSDAGLSPPPAVSPPPRATAPAAVRPPPPPPARSGLLARPPAGRLVLVALGTAMVAVLAGVVGALALGTSPARLFTRQAQELSAAPNPDFDLQLQYLPHLKQGRQLLEKGQPALALEAFDRALNIAPENRGARRLRDRAQREVLAMDGVGFEQSFVTQRLEDARSALGRRDYARAQTLASEVLDVDPGNREARNLRAQADDGLERKRSTQNRLSSTPLGRPRSGAEEDEAPALPTTAAPVAANTEATLAIDFFSEISEGVLTIYAGQDQILKESFRFVEKVNVFKSRGTSGQITANRKLRAGTVALKVYIYRKGAGTEFTELEGNLPGGETRQLKIQLSTDGKLLAQLL